MLVFFLALGCANEWQALDADGDGWTVAAGDCWDETALHGELEGSEIHPEAPDVPYDGVDADCAGDDDFDHDGDGYVTSVWVDAVTEGIPSTLPGGDCWDDRDEIEQEFGALPGFPQLAAADVHPGAKESWYDGIDADCDGGDDFDQDTDGHASAFHRDGAGALGDDCFDADEDAFENPEGLDPAAVHPEAFDECYDYTDANCDGASDWDCDLDGFLDDADCDDKDPEANPAAIEKWYDGIDQDCDGNDADKDYDGFLVLDYAGKVKAPGIEEGDCWDDPDEPHVPLNGLPELGADDVHPFAIETWYDGINQDCADEQDFDQDLDGYDVVGMDGSSGDDCVDTDAAIHPDQDETCATDFDDNCVDGNNDPGADGCDSYYDDEDGDGHGAVGIPAQCTCGFPPWNAEVDDDCDDAVSSVYGGAPEMVDNGRDEDCDGQELCYDDGDDDGYLDDAGATTLFSTDLDCSDPFEGGGMDPITDCDDDDAAINPGAKEDCNNGIDDDCDDSPGTCALMGPSVAIDGEAEAWIDGAAGSGFGYAIAAGELGGDATPDVAVTAMNGTGDGTVYGYFGPLTALGTDSFDISGTSGARFGESLAAGMDLDFDGDDDLAIGSPLGDSSTKGVTFVFFGPLTGSYSSTEADVSLIGPSIDEQLGVSLATGDWNDDGKDDLAIGAHTADYGAEKAGALWVLEGEIDGTDLDDAVARFDGVNTSDRATRSIASGDTNGDGYDDVAVGVPGLGTADEGAVYVVLGPFSGESSFATSADSEIPGESGGGAAGTAVALVDFEGSGYADLLVGAPGVAQAYLVDDFSIADLASASAIIEGAGDAGAAVGSAGDFDNDGRLDLFVGAPVNSHLSIFYERPSGTVDVSSDADLVLEGTKPDDLGAAARSLGDQDGDAIDDLMVAAPAATSGAGTTWILLGSGF